MLIAKLRVRPHHSYDISKNISHIQYSIASRGLTTIKSRSSRVGVTFIIKVPDLEQLNQLLYEINLSSSYDGVRLVSYRKKFELSAIQNILKLGGN